MSKRSLIPKFSGLRDLASSTSSDVAPKPSSLRIPDKPLSLSSAVSALNSNSLSQKLSSIPSAVPLLGASKTQASLSNASSGGLGSNINNLMNRLHSVRVAVSTKQDYPFTEQDFQRIRNLIYEKAGISLNSSKRDMVYGRLVLRLRDLKLNSFMEYLNYLATPGNSSELELFIDALTTNLTFFFREEHHFPILAEYARSKNGAINAWCCAASTGEEPYSMAITLLESSAPDKVKLLATDLNTNVLKRAEAGVYSKDKMTKVSNYLRDKYFDRTPEGNFVAKSVLKKMITFKKLNLVDPRYDIGNSQFDVIFCRNVMIYFDAGIQYSILEKLKSYLKVDGLIFFGHSENFYHATKLFKPNGRTVYKHA